MGLRSRGPRTEALPHVGPWGKLSSVPSSTVPGLVPQPHPRALPYRSHLSASDVPSRPARRVSSYASSKAQLGSPRSGEPESCALFVVVTPQPRAHNPLQRASPCDHAV